LIVHGTQNAYKSILGRILYLSSLFKTAKFGDFPETWIVQERRKTLQLETAERHLIAEVSSHQQTESLLQQARQHNLQLESENAELVSTTLITSSSHLSEMKALRLELAEERKLRKLAENSTSEAVATVTGSSPPPPPHPPPPTGYVI
jgi:hypothetical protein